LEGRNQYAGMERMGAIAKGYEFEGKIYCNAGRGKHKFRGKETMPCKGALKVGRGNRKRGQSCNYTGEVGRDQGRIIYLEATWAKKKKGGES